MMINIVANTHNNGLHVVQSEDLDMVLADADEIAVTVNGVEAKVPVSEFIRLWHRHRPYLPSDQYRPTRVEPPMVEFVTAEEGGGHRSQGQGRRSAFGFLHHLGETRGFASLVTGSRANPV